MKLLARCLLVVALAGTVVAPQLRTIQGQAPDPVRPAFVVQPYLQLPTPTSMNVLWETNYKLAGEVEFGPTRDLGRTAEHKGAGEMHQVALTGLQPATTYHYRVRSGDLVSEIYSFRSAPPPGTKKWRLALYGDSRSNPPVHAQVATQIGKAKADLIVHTGDIVWTGRFRDGWRLEFFQPLGPLAQSTPWAATIGNHETDREAFRSYVALPDKERYFAFDYGNAHFILLDSNAWIEKGRDSKQYEWLAKHLKEKRTATWTFVVFHHPLFSAMLSRPLNPLRWDWAPLLLDPANGVDGVLTGHDHFYARNFRMGRVGKEPQPGVLFITSAGGGARLYRSTGRDYVAEAKDVHHFVLFEFDGAQVVLTAIDANGRAFDRSVLTKKPTPPDEYCAYEIEELRHNLRRALNAAPEIKTSAREATVIDTKLHVPIKFQVPIEGRFLWTPAEKWKLKKEKSAFRLEAGQGLDIPLQAEVAPGRFGRTPELTIQFAEGKFRNRTIVLSPFKLAGQNEVRVSKAAKPPTIDGKFDDAIWQRAEPYALIGLPPRGGRSDLVRFAFDADHLYLAARLDDPSGTVKVTPPEPRAESSRQVLFGEHVRLVVSDGQQSRMFAVAQSQLRYATADDKEDSDSPWRAAVAAEKGAWSVEMAIPRKLFAANAELQVNVIRRQGNGLKAVDYLLCPTYEMGPDPDDIPDWVAGDAGKGIARVSFVE